MSLRSFSVIISSFLVLVCVNLLAYHSTTGALSRAYAMPNPHPQTTISPFQCQNMPVLCCSTIEPLSAILNLVDQILSALGLTSINLATLIGLNCNPTILGLACSATPVCCTTDIPTSGKPLGIDSTAVFCTPVSQLLPL
ncbi:hypothetical protein SCHPADRAFT_117530 [Schizopora paradoxa]|uniref:Hydrophobin n=1 Tax=Schizopora paradoxa TaxID=27342 RepID=A0A0H2S2V4_9AGAM|nr:hypothetical protein SCHPADRAFT_117530 [Schizopora paradoxa]